MIKTELASLGDYPFTKLKKLLATPSIASGKDAIDAGAGEPRQPLPGFVSDMLQSSIETLSSYPSTTGCMALRQSIANWLISRYRLDQLDAASQVLTANGTREALFAVAQMLSSEKGGHQSIVMMPNPMYQIYYGATVLSGAEPYFLPCEAEAGFEPELDQVPQDVWRRTSLVYICSPGNPTGWVASEVYLRQLLQLADEHDFIVCSDECYSEIYMDTPPVGLLEVAQHTGRTDYSRCLVFNSLSKRSSLPGLRSGFIAGDAALIHAFARLRSYTGPATPVILQKVAQAAWEDEVHVETVHAVYRQSIQSFSDAYQGRHTLPSGGFFMWLPVNDDVDFAVRAYQTEAVTLLPGRYLSVPDNGHDPGRNFVRVALVDGEVVASDLGARLSRVCGA